jgi:hypothetical protein
MDADLMLYASYVLKTGAGISAYSPTVEHPLYGGGQGTRWAPAAWVVMSTLIIALMH